MREIQLTAKFIAGAVVVESVKGGLQPWRLPPRELRLFPPDEALSPMAPKGAGVRVRFETNAREAVLNVLPLDQPRNFDLVIGNVLEQTVRLEAGESQIRFARNENMRTVWEVWLPQSHPTTLVSLTFQGRETCRPASDRRPRWAAYGSSITQCGTAPSPARTWPSIAARHMDLNLTCLGFGGNCHMEPMVARVLRDLKADFYSLEVGINIQGMCSLSPRTFRPALIGFVKLIRESALQAPLTVVSPVCCPDRETVKNSVGLSLADVRLEVADAVERLQTAGDCHIRYLNGLSLFGPDLAAKHLPDKLHPDAEGCEAIGRRFAEANADFFVRS